MNVLNDLLGRITERGRTLIGPGDPGADLLAQARALLSNEGEASGVARARNLLDRYHSLDPRSKAAFLSSLAVQIGPDLDRVIRGIEQFEADPGPATARDLHDAAEPRTDELLRRLNRAPQGTRDLVRMRADLIEVQPMTPELAGLDRDFRRLLSGWFNRGFLALDRIDWHTPAVVLEKIIAYEAVHAIHDWEDLRRRVAAPDRRLYAFFHPAMRDDPLIFVEVALLRDIPSAIGPILAKEREPLARDRVTTAVFYSISNCQKGLRGVSFGHFLIKQVVEELRQDFDMLKTFVTLSPVPGLRSWVQTQLGEGEMLTADDRARLAAFEGEDDDAPLDGADDFLASVAARYLVEARDRRGGPADPVARFHLSNGARLEAVHARADPGMRARRSAYGIMVNYRYDLGEIERNHEAFVQSGQVKHSSAVRRLLRTR